MLIMFIYVVQRGVDNHPLDILWWTPVDIVARANFDIHKIFALFLEINYKCDKEAANYLLNPDPDYLDDVNSFWEDSCHCEGFTIPMSAELNSLGVLSE